MHLVEPVDSPKHDYYIPLAEDVPAFVDHLQQWMDVHPSPDDLYRIQHQSQYAIMRLDFSDSSHMSQSLIDLVKAFEDYDKSCRKPYQWQFPLSNGEPLIVKYCEVDSFVREYIIQPLSPVEYLGYLIEEDFQYLEMIRELRELRDMPDTYFEQYEPIILDIQDSVMEADVYDSYAILWAFSLSLKVPQAQLSQYDDLPQLSVYAQSEKEAYRQMKEILDTLP